MAWRTICGVTLLALLVACGGKGPAAQRVIPAQLPEPERDAARLLPFDGAHNFRELGGYRTADGRSTRWGVLYRSDTLADLSEQDQLHLKLLGINSVVDLRSDDDRPPEPDRRTPDLTLRYVIDPVTVDGTAIEEISQRLRSGELEGVDFRAMLIEGNRRFVSDFGGAYARFLRELAQADNLPLVFHCTGGKDRAGFAAALALLAVGVPRETVIEDFLKTNTYTADRIERNLLILRVVSLFRTDPELARPLLGVEPAYIESALDTIEREYGGLQAYLRDELGIDDDTLSKLRENLLES